MSSELPRMKVDPTLSLGNILTIAGVLFAALMAFLDLRYQVSRHTDQITEIQRAVNDISTDLKSVRDYLLPKRADK